MQGRKISSGVFANIRYETRECCGEHINFMTALGPISREHRIPVYRKILKTNPSSNFFAILDNRAGYEDEMSFEDMQILGDLLLRAGINRMISVAVTEDTGYRNIVKLSHAVAATKNIEIQSTSTSCFEDAISFILSRMGDVSVSTVIPFRTERIYGRA